MGADAVGADRVGWGALFDADSDRRDRDAEFGAAGEHFASGANSYSAFKAAVTNWTLGQAQTLGTKGIRCNVVSPGPIWVEGGDWNRVKDGKPEFFAATEKVHPGGRIGGVQDVANAVVFLASPVAGHINGANLTVDGGFMKRVNY